MFRQCINRHNLRRSANNRYFILRQHFYLLFALSAVNKHFELFSFCMNIWKMSEQTLIKVFVKIMTWCAGSTNRWGFFNFICKLFHVVTSLKSHVISHVCDLCFSDHALNSLTYDFSSFIMIFIFLDFLFSIYWHSGYALVQIKGK